MGQRLLCALGGQTAGLGREGSISSLSVEWLDECGRSSAGPRREVRVISDELLLRPTLLGIARAEMVTLYAG